MVLDVLAPRVDTQCILVCEVAPLPNLDVLGILWSIHLRHDTRSEFYNGIHIVYMELELGLLFLVRLLEEARVAVIPGEPFGNDSVIRLSFANSMSEINKGLDRIEWWMKKNG